MREGKIFDALKSDIQVLSSKQYLKLASKNSSSIDSVEVIVPKLNRKNTKVGVKFKVRFTTPTWSI